MELVNLYRYERESGKWTTSPEKPADIPCTLMYRLVADDGKLLTADGEHTTPCADIDVSDLPGWYEVDDPDWDGGDPPQTEEEDFE